MAEAGANYQWDEEALEAYLNEAVYALPVLFFYCFAFSLHNILWLNRWFPWLAWLDSGIRWARLQVRSWLYSQVERDLFIVIAVRRMRMNLPAPVRSLMDLLAAITEFTVSIPFFVSLIPLLYLVGYTNEASILLIGLACLSLLVSNLKDNLCTPRPSQHPSILTKLNRPEDMQLLQDFLAIKVEQDYGCPSLHGACSLFFGLSITSLILSHNPQAAEEGELTMLPAFIWCGWVCFTRLWLGVHSMIDLVLGAIVGMSVFYSWRLSAPLQVSLLFPTKENAISGALVEQIEAAGWTPSAYSLLYSIMGLINHWVSFAFIPKPIHKTESFEHTTTWMGAWGGLLISRILLGVSCGVQSKKGNSSISSPLYSYWAKRAIFNPYLWPRVALGLVVSGLVRVVAKQELTPYLSWLLNRMGPLRRFLQPPVATVPLPTFFSPPGSVEDMRQQEQAALVVARSAGDAPADVDALRRYLNYSLLTLSVLTFHEFF
jgi:membrane-associated phospholipid phosphatase